MATNKKEKNKKQLKVKITAELTYDFDNFEDIKYAAEDIESKLDELRGSGSATIEVIGI